MRADEAITIENADSMFVGMNYINQLRYERLMAKAEKFNVLAENKEQINFTEARKDYEWHNELEEYDIAQKCLENMDYWIRYCEKCNRIAEALEARARRIKEGM